MKIERTNTDGTMNYYDHEDVETGKTDNYEINFSKWNGKGPLCVANAKLITGRRD